TLSPAFQTTFTVALPDLVVGGVSLSATSASFGDTLTVSWKVVNTGAAPAQGPWTDNVYLSPSPALGTDAILLGSAPTASTGPLAPLASYDSHLIVQLPA